ncbi:tyrosine-type recombinase/integrase [Niastella caeni]|uniref:tyrosine-type recombinase/integrase n=1 Tax=Niastella caeni TaxID=2569763 RepID=UPI00140A3C1A|nr:site-specific integrase [Niastella caeni]
MEYYFLNPETHLMERFRPTFKMNYKRTLSDRYAWGHEAVKFMKERLKEGYNPFEEIKLQSQPVTNKVVIIPTCKDQLQKILDELCKISTPNAGETYRLMFGRWKKYLDAKNKGQLKIDEVNLSECLQFQTYLKEDCKLARKTVNATVSHLGILWDELKIGSNPFRNVPVLKAQRGRKLKESRKDIFEPFTAKELERIIKHLLEKEQRPFVRFLAFIYYAWARPIEIMRLRIKDIDLTNRAIIFRKEETKNDKPAMVQILDPLYEFLVEMDLGKYPDTFYIFGRNGYLPGEVMLNQRYHFNDLWNDLVKYSELQIDKNPYALKHSGNIEYLIKNKGKVDLKWQQRQNRHSSAVQTEKYNRALGVYFIDTEQINFNSFI